MEREREARDHFQFPDEIDTPQYIPASQRFAKYRGLKSFRNSPWDPLENLPIDYARIFQFQNYKRSKKRAIEMIENEGVVPGTRVTVEISNVPSAIKDADRNQVFVIFGLFPHEHKFSVINFTVTRSQNYTDTVRSKDPMILMMGFRRYVVNPIYSTYTRGGANNVHKFERYLQHGKTFVGTVYAPIQFGHEPVMLFKHNPNSTWVDGIRFLCRTFDAICGSWFSS
jgi:pre-rRNA-processing protein TSR1